MAFHLTGVLAVAAMLAGVFAVAPAGAATAIQSVAVAEDQIVIRFASRIADATGRVLTGGRRQLAVDIADAIPGALVTVGGPVRAIRQLRNGDGARVVFDLTSPTIIVDGGFDAGGKQLTLSLLPVDQRRFDAAGAQAPINFFPFNVGSLSGRPKYKVSRLVPPRAKSAGLPKVSGDEDRPLVVIDAGHGGVDPGAINGTTGLREKDVTLRIARAMRDELLAGGRVRVALTRDKDRYLILRERYGVARRLKADLFISVHCDSVGSGDASGASVYTLSEVASDKEAARLAARENKADVIAGVNLGDAGADVSSILIDLAQRETMNASAGFARLLAREAKPLIPTKAKFHRMASLMVLKAPDMPSILFETGYISNPVDAAFIDSTEGRKRIAESVRRAVEVYFARRLVAR